MQPFVVSTVATCYITLLSVVSGVTEKPATTRHSHRRPLPVTWTPLMSSQPRCRRRHRLTSRWRHLGAAAAARHAAWVTRGTWGRAMTHWGHLLQHVMRLTPRRCWSITSTERRRSTLVVRVVSTVHCLLSAYSVSRSVRQVSRFRKKWKERLEWKLAGL